MKKVSILTALFTFVACYSLLTAQTSQGSFMLGMRNFAPVGLLGPFNVPITNSLGFSIQTIKSKQNGQEQDGNTKVTSFGLTGSAHYFIIDNLSAGLNLSFSSQKYRFEGDGDDETSNFTLLMAGPEVRYYLPVGEKNRIWFGGSAGFGSAKIDLFEGDAEPSKISRYGGGAGFSLFPNQHFSIDLGLGYSIFNTKDEYEFLGQKVKNEDTVSGLTFDVGFSVFF